MIFGLVQQRLDSGLGEAPRARVQGFFLRPDDGFGVGVGVEVLAQLCPGERVELLDAGYRCGFEGFVGSTVLVEGSVDLARAKNDTVNFVVRADGAFRMCGVRDNPLEMGVAREVFNGGAGERMAKEGFGEEDNEC